MTTSIRRLAVALTLAALAGTAAAHTGHGAHGAHGLKAGLEHPLGADHLLAMLAVGVWSVFALPAGKTWQGPAIFMAALVASAALGASGLSVPYLEFAISGSVVVFGAMLILAKADMPTGAGLALIAVAATLHGLAHGAEAPASGGFASYAAGFLLTTAALHFGGVFGGLALRRGVAQQTTRVLGGLGLAVGGAGTYLLMQL